MKCMHIYQKDNPIHLWQMKNQCIKLHIQYVVFVLVANLCPIFLQPHGLQPTSLLCQWDSPGKNTGMGCHFLLYLHNTITNILYQNTNLGCFRTYLSIFYIYTHDKHLQRSGSTYIKYQAQLSLEYGIWDLLFSY